MLNKLHQKPSDAAFSTVIFRDNFPPEAVSDVISGMAVQDVGMDECANFGDSRLKLSAGFRTSITSEPK